MNKQRGIVSNTSTNDVSNELDQLESSIAKLKELIGTVSQYVNDVVTGKVQGDSRVGKFLADTLSSLPRLNHEQFDREFNGQLQDLLMVAYLSNMMRAQLNIAQKLSNTL